ncbi:hypothetical protein FJTKL_04857 [Diaporthe vaccinii]|uniref:Uncharacterized protein n=1 Tax=Diaporthe vaccinii TaxID=105482 RepID=A0ABR4DS63_9PEZI
MSSQPCTISLCTLTHLSCQPCFPYAVDPNCNLDLSPEMLPWFYPPFKTYQQGQHFKPGPKLSILPRHQSLHVRAVATVSLYVKFQKLVCEVTPLTTAESPSPPAQSPRRR